MGYNDTGQQTYGAGEIHFAPFLEGTQTRDAFRYLGNTPGFSLTPSSEDLDHFDVDHGVKELDDSIQTSSSLAGTLQTDNINKENTALVFTGTAGIISQASGSGKITNIDAINYGTYQLGVTDSNPTGDFSVSTVVVTDGAVSSPVTYVAGVDYVVDTVRGQVTFLEGGDIQAGDPAKISYSTVAASRTEVISSNKTISGALLYKSFAPKGPMVDHLMPYVRLRPDGDYNLKSDNSWLTMSFAMKVLRLGSQARIYANGIAVTA